MIVWTAEDAAQLAERIAQFQEANRQVIQLGEELMNALPPAWMTVEDGETFFEFENYPPGATLWIESEGYKVAHITNDQGYLKYIVPKGTVDLVVVVCYLTASRRFKYRVNA